MSLLQTFYQVCILLLLIDAIFIIIYQIKIFLHNNNFNNTFSRVLETDKSGSFLVAFVGYISTVQLYQRRNLCVSLFVTILIIMISPKVIMLTINFLSKFLTKTSAWLDNI